MLYRSIIVVGLFSVLTSADLTGTNPPNGSCLCFNANSVNVRNQPCGSVIGSANNGQCFTYHGTKQTCTLSGVSYEFFNINFGGLSSWSAGNFMILGQASQCSTSTTGGYTCQLTNQGGRVHETTGPTPFDCRASGCGNTCQGGQCVAYVTCRCTRDGLHLANTACWRPGERLRLADGRCNRSIPPNTAIATFDNNGNYYAGHAAVFVGCADDFTIRTYDQWCCRSIGYSTYGSSHSYYPTFAVITNPGICADRPTWNCRFEGAGSTCCPTSVPGCLKSNKWWEPFVDEKHPVNDTSSD